MKGIFHTLNMFATDPARKVFLLYQPSLTHFVIPLTPDVIPLTPDVIPLTPDVILLTPDVILLTQDVTPLTPDLSQPPGKYFFLHRNVRSVLYRLVLARAVLVPL